MAIYIGTAEVGKIYVGSAQVGKVYDNTGKLIYSSEVALSNLSTPIPSGGPGTTGSHTITATSSSYWDLSGITSLTMTVQNDIRIGYWQGGGSVSHSNRQIILVFNDGSTLVACDLGGGTGPAIITVNLAGKTDNQKTKVYLRGTAIGSCSTVTGSAYYGSASATNVVGA